MAFPRERNWERKCRKPLEWEATVKDGCIEIQGDEWEEVKWILEEAGFNPVFAGG